MFSSLCVCVCMYVCAHACVCLFHRDYPTHYWLLHFMWLCHAQRLLISRLVTWYATLFIYFQEITNIRRLHGEIQISRFFWKTGSPAHSDRHGGGNEHELSPAVFGLISPGVAELISLASCGRLSHIPISLRSRCPPGDPGFSSWIVIKVYLYLLTLLNPETSMSQLLVLMLVPLITMMGLKLVSGECTEGQGSRKGLEEESPGLVTYSICPLDACHVAFSIF